MINVEIKKLDKSQLEITGEIGAAEFASFWKKAVAKLSQSVKIDGFRTGHIPEDVLIKNITEGAVLDEAAELALQNEYPKIILANKIDAIGRPMISITKIAKGNPLGYKIITAVIPEVTLPDYAGMAKEIFDEAKKKEVVVTEKEVDDLAEEIRRRRAHIDEVGKKEEVKADLPVFDDAFVKTLGDFADVADFKAKMMSNLKMEKESAAKEETRYKTIEAVNEESEMELPDILVENELNKGMHQMKNDVERAGMEFADYLKEIKKTEEDIRKESRGKAEKSVRFNLILKNIARKEKITVPAEEINKEAERLVKMYEGADLESAKVYVEDILINNKVFQFLEKGEL